MARVCIMLVLFFWASLAAGAWGQNESVANVREQQPARLDFQGDPLPSGALGRLGSARLRHGHLVKDVAFSPDGTTVASAGSDHTVRLWDAATGKELRRFTTEQDRSKPFSPSRWPYCIAFSPDGKRLACGDHADGWSVNTIRIWEVATGNLLHKIQRHSEGVLAVAFSPDGVMLASASADQTVCLWNGATGQELRRLVGHRAVVRSVAFSPDGKTLATAGDDRTVRLWDPATGQELHQLVGHEAEALSVCFSTDGQNVVSGSRDRTARVWDPVTGKERAVLRGHGDEVFRVCFAPNGKTLASASKDRTIRFWNVARGKKVGSLEGIQKAVSGLSFSPNGETLASITTDRVCLWNLNTGKEIHPQPGHQATVRGLGFLRDGRLVSVGLDGMIRWWDWRKGKEQRRVPWEKMPDWTAFFPQEAELIALGSDLIALGSAGGHIQLLDKTSGQGLGWLENTMGPIVSLAISPDDKTLGSSDSKNVQLWDTATRKVSRQLPQGPGGTKFVRFASDGKLVLAGNDAANVWDVAKDKPIRDLPVSFRSLRSAVFSPDSRMLACGDSNGNVELWDVDKGEKARVGTGLAGYVRVAFSRNGRLMAGGGWGSIKVWETETGQERHHFDGFEGDAFAMAFSPDGRALASGVGDTSILIWDLPGSALAMDPGFGDGQQVVQMLWKDLASEDGARVRRAIWGLVGRQVKAVPYLTAVLRPVPGVGDQYLMQLTKDLDNESFPVREKATKELQKLGEVAELALRKLVANPPGLEAKLRAKRLLEELTRPLASPERLQAIRAIEALEYMGTPEARELLRELSRGAPGARVTREATASLERLRKR